MLRSADIPVPTIINSEDREPERVEQKTQAWWSEVDEEANRVKWKDSNSEVTTPCHFGARWRLQHLLMFLNSSRAHFATLHPCLEVCPHLTMPTYVPCTCEVYSVHAYTQYRPLSEHLVSMVLSYWRSSAELEDLLSTFMRVMHCTVTLGIVVECVHATMYTTWSPSFSTWPPVIPWKPDA